jgi:hypothetical protein
MAIEDLIIAIESRAWYPAAALVLWYVLDAWKKCGAGRVLPRVPDGWRWLPPLFVAAVTGFVDGYVSQLPLSGSLWRAAFAVVALGLPAMGVQSGLKESPLRGAPGTLTALLLCAGLALPVTTACADKPATTAATERTAALAYTGAVVALEVLDAREAAYLDSIAQPTPEQLKAAEGRVERLKRARDALALVRDWLSGRRDQPAKGELGQAAQALRLVVEELRADGVRIPASVLDGIQLAEIFAGVAS